LLVQAAALKARTASKAASSKLQDAQPLGEEAQLAAKPKVAQASAARKAAAADKKNKEAATKAAASKQKAAVRQAQLQQPSRPGLQLRDRGSIKTSSKYADQEFRKGGRQTAKGQAAADPSALVQQDSSSDSDGGRSDSDVEEDDSSSDNTHSSSEHEDDSSSEADDSDRDGSESDEDVNSGSDGDSEE
jgi:hypothetical protein